MRGGHHGKGLEKSNNFSESIKKLIKYGKSYWKIIIFCIILAVVGSLISIIAPNKISSLVDEISLGLVGEINLNNVISIIIFLSMIYIISTIISLVQGIIMAKTTNSFARELRDDISKKINKLPLAYFDKNTYGDVLSRVTNDVDTINQSFQNSIITLIASAALLLAALFMMFYTNWIMATAAVVSTLIGFILIAIIMMKGQKYFNEKQEAIGNLNGQIEEVYSNHTIVKAYNGKKDSSSEFNELNLKEYKANIKSQFISGLMQPLMGFSGDFSYVVICIVGAILVKNNLITFGVIVAFIMYIRIFMGPLRQIAMALTQLQSAAAASERVFEFLEETEMTDESTLKTKLNPKKIKGDIEFKDVKFAYEKDKLVIKDFSASIKAGSKIAIVGPTGAGKTTLVNLLMKFYKLTAGDILIDGISIHDLTRENIHDLFIMVLQDTWLFEGTMKENMVYNNKNISNKKINEITKVIGLDHFIKTTNNGLDHEIKDADSISAGQKQLITIARGMISNSPMVILDEATSNVDTRTEELVQEAMDKLTQGRTSFIIAHRLSTIKNADLIFVMNEGNIIEQGTHDDLLNEDGFYTELYNSQFTKL